MRSGARFASKALVLSAASDDGATKIAVRRVGPALVRAAVGGDRLPGCQRRREIASAGRSKIASRRDWRFVDWAMRHGRRVCSGARFAVKAMIGRNFSGDYFQLVLRRNLPQKIANPALHLPRQHPLAVFRAPHKMNLEVVLRVAA